MGHVELFQQRCDKSRRKLSGKTSYAQEEIVQHTKQTRSALGVKKEVLHIGGGKRQTRGRVHG